MIEAHRLHVLRLPLTPETYMLSWPVINFLNRGAVVWSFVTPWRAGDLWDTLQLLRDPEQEKMG